MPVILPYHLRVTGFPGAGIMRCITGILFCSALLAACSSESPKSPPEGGFYSYVDAQGNLVTMPRKDSGQNPSSAPSAKKSAGDSSGGMEEGGVKYESSQEAEQRIKKQESDRFVTYPGPDGQTVTHPLDLPKERKAAQKAQKENPGYETIQPGKGRNYLETVTRIKADCCRHLIAGADSLDAGKEQRVKFLPVSGWVEVGGEHPARVFRLGKGARMLTLQSFVTTGGFVAPGMLFLDKNGTPVLKVANIFQRRYPETWYRYSFYQGKMSCPSDAAYVLLYLPYAGRQGKNRAVRLPETDASPDMPALRLKGDLVLTAMSAPAQADETPAPGAAK